MSMKKTIILTMLGTVLATGLRFCNFWFLYEQDTGFLKDNGILSFAAVGVMLVILAAQLVFYWKNKSGLRYVTGQSFSRAGVSLLSALTALYGLWAMYNSYQAQLLANVKEVSPTGLSVRVPFMVMTGILALYLLFAAAVHALGREELFGRAKVLELIPVLWGLLFILYVFIHYSVSFLVSENIFVVFSACALTVALLNKAKFLSGADEGGRSFQKLAAAGSFAFMIVISYTVSELLLAAAGGVQPGDLPREVQLVAAVLALNALVFAATAKGEKMQLQKTKPEHNGKRYRTQ